jgi:hypothetical protein
MPPSSLYLMQVRVSRRRQSHTCGKSFVTKCNSRLNWELFQETLDNEMSISDLSAPDAICFGSAE